MNIANRTILITGAGSGIGRAMALAFARHRCHIILFGRQADPLAETQALVAAAGGTAVPVAGDVTNPAARQAALDAAAGRLDILINNAGAIVSGRLETTPEADLRALIEVNLTAPLLFAQAAIPLLRHSPAGTIVNVSSGMGLLGMPFYVPYVATKAAIARAGEALRRELAPDAIRVITLYPTATETPMMRTTRIGASQGVPRETPEAVADALIEGLLTDQTEIIRGSPDRIDFIRRNATAPAEIDAHFAEQFEALATATAGHRWI